MTEDRRPAVWPRNFARLHAFLFVASAVALYRAPEVAFGDAAWQPLARLAVGLLAATLVALAVVLLGAVRSGSVRTLRLAFVAVLVVDGQAPVLLSLHPAVFDHLERDLGIPWFSASLALVGLVVITMLGLLSLGDGYASSQGSGEA